MLIAHTMKNEEEEEEEMNNKASMLRISVARFKYFIEAGFE
jgi:hypothetical protein